MKNIFDQLTDLLKKDERLVSQDGVLLKNQTQELARKNDPALIKLLLSDKTIKQHFFFEVEKTLIFDKEKFIRFVSNKQFLPDSYTAFKNKIGLTAGDEYVSENKEVVLAWPYKDCVLEGGMTKEDQKRDEIFWNTHKKFTYCKCKKIWVDSCEFTPLDMKLSNGEIVRIGGKEEDRKIITK